MTPSHEQDEIRLKAIQRINRTLRRWFPDGQVHRDHMADAFACGMRAAVTFEVPDEEVAAEFEVYCEEAFSE